MSCTIQWKQKKKETFYTMYQNKWFKSLAFYEIKIWKSAYWNGDSQWMHLHLYTSKKNLLFFLIIWFKLYGLDEILWFCSLTHIHSQSREVIHEVHCHSPIFFCCTFISPISPIRSWNSIQQLLHWRKIYLFFSNPPPLPTLTLSKV